MKELALALAFVAALWIAGLNTATAQGHSGSHGKPSQTGVEHAETVTNPKGVQHSIENAKAEQSLHKGSLKTIGKPRPSTRIASTVARLTEFPT